MCSFYFIHQSFVSATYYNTTNTCTTADRHPPVDFTQTEMLEHYNFILNDLVCFLLFELLIDRKNALSTSSARYLFYIAL